jgi:predicted enzyme related to lactoylglutathione lyase
VEIVARGAAPQRRDVMAQTPLPEPFGISVTVDDLDAARRFYTGLYEHDRVLKGVYGGIRYLSVMRGGETQVNIFQKGEGNPLAPVFPTLKVDSVPAYVERITALGGGVLLPPGLCPCTETAFAVCVDAAGNQLLIKEPRGAGA